MLLFIPQPLRAVRVLFSPMVSGCVGRFSGDQTGIGEKFVPAISRKP